MRNMLTGEKERLENFEKQITILSPTNKIINSRQELSNLYEKVVNSITSKLNDEKTKISLLSSTDSEGYTSTLITSLIS